VAVPLGLLLLVSVGAFAGYFAITRRNSNATTTQLARMTAQALAQTQTAESWTPTPTRQLPTPVPTLVPGEIAKLFAGPHLLAILLDDNRLLQAPASEPWLIAVNHRGVGANANIHLEGGAQLQLQGVTDARVQVRLLEGSRIFVQSGPYPNGAEIEFAGVPVVTTVRGCLGTEYSEPGTLTVHCYQGACTLSTDFGVTSAPIAAGQAVTVNLSGLEAGDPRPVSGTLSLPYWSLLLQTFAGADDARQCDVPQPPLPTATTRSGGGSGPAPAPPTNTPAPPTEAAPEPPEPPATEPPAEPPPPAET